MDAKCIGGNNVLEVKLELLVFSFVTLLMEKVQKVESKVFEFQENKFKIAQKNFQEIIIKDILENPRVTMIIT